MLTFEKFSGLNNVLPAHRLGNDALTVAVNVDIGLTGEIKRRQGFTQRQAACHKNLHQAQGFMLATIDGDLTAIGAGGNTLIYPALGPGRVRYCNLPDGRTTFSNGLINGITDGASLTSWGVPTPESAGAATPVTGQLHPGSYRYQITYVRLSDGLEGAPLHTDPVDLPDGGILVAGLPVLDGHMINVYLTGRDSDHAFLVGSTEGSAFSYLGGNDALTLPCRTDHMQPAPVGTFTAFWSGRALVAVGPVLYASRTNSWESFDIMRDFKQFPKPITMIQPVDDGIYVGTEGELAFLAGNEFDKLAYRQVIDVGVVPGSGVAVPGDLVQLGQSVGSGSAMICIAGGAIVAGFNGGTVSRMTDGRYTTSAAEVAATFRQVGGIPQYVAIPQ